MLEVLFHSTLVGSVRCWYPFLSKVAVADGEDRSIETTTITQGPEARGQVGGRRVMLPPDFL